MYVFFFFFRSWVIDNVLKLKNEIINKPGDKWLAVFPCAMFAVPLLI